MMDRVTTVCLLGFGEVGSLLAEQLLANIRLSNSVKIIAWDSLFPVVNSRPNQRCAALSSSPQFQKADSALTAVEQADLIISAVTADQTIAAAEAVATGLLVGTWFLDLNSVSPNTKRRAATLIDAKGGRYVEAAVMGPIAPKGLNTAILLAGPHAKAFMPMAESLGFGAISVASDQPGQAAATKMCRSVIVKGMEALVTEAMLAARFYGVEDEVLRSLNNLLPHPDWRSHAQYMISRSLEHGQRRAEEMREVSKTLSDAGVTPWMSAACVERQQWAAGERELVVLLDAMRIL